MLEESVTQPSDEWLSFKMTLGKEVGTPGKQVVCLWCAVGTGAQKGISLCPKARRDLRCVGIEVHGW